MVPIVIALVPALVTVTLLAALVVDTCWLPKLNGDPVSSIALPSPVRLTVLTWLKKPLVSTVIFPLRLPEAVGTKDTYIAQVVPFVSAAGQSSASLKFVLAEILLMVTGP